VIEALACGAAVVASDLPTLLEAGGGAVRHAAVGDHAGWADAVMSVMSVMEGHQQQIGCEHAARFTWSRHAEIISGAYARLDQTACG